MIVCIAEKPSVARDIADVLGAKDKKDGYIEGNGYQVTWTFGHLCTLKEPHEYTPNWKSWSLGSLPIPAQYVNGTRCRTSQHHLQSCRFHGLLSLRGDSMCSGTYASLRG
jgi:DNA topoisomerase IA